MLNRDRQHTASISIVGSAAAVWGSAAAAGRVCSSNSLIDISIARLIISSSSSTSTPPKASGSAVGAGTALPVFPCKVTNPLR